MKKEKLTFNTYDMMKKVRSPFATCKMTGAGAHKSKKDFKRKSQKLQDKKLFDSYRYLKIFNYFFYF